MIETKFKQTEIGAIPEDWDFCKLGSLCSIHGRIGFRGYTVKDIVTKGNGAISLSPSNIINGKITYCNNTYISWFKYHESPEIKVRENDILIVKTGSTVGKTAIVKNLNEKATINPQFVVLKNIMCNSQLLSYIIANNIIQNQIKAFIVGGAIPTLSQEKIANFSIPISKNIFEQKRITAALTSIDNLITSLSALIEKKKLIKQGTMQQLLTAKRRLPGFSDPWVEKKLGEIGALSMCKRIFQEETSETGDVPFYKIGTFGKVADSYISFKKYRSFKNLYRFPNKGDILISAAGTIGRTVVYDGKPSYFQDSNIVWLSHDESQITNVYLLYLYENIEWNTENTTVARLYNGNFNNTIIFLPSLSEQTAIANVLTSMDNEIASLEAKKAKYETIKQGMMQQLLTGKIRLI